jgi:hypothetical protein
VHATGAGGGAERAARGLRRVRQGAGCVAGAYWRASAVLRPYSRKIMRCGALSELSRGSVRRGMVQPDGGGGGGREGGGGPGGRAAGCGVAVQERLKLTHDRKFIPSPHAHWPAGPPREIWDRAYSDIRSGPQSDAASLVPGRTGPPAFSSGPARWNRARLAVPSWPGGCTVDVDARLPRAAHGQGSARTRPWPHCSTTNPALSLTRGHADAADAFPAAQRTPPP